MLYAIMFVSVVIDPSGEEAARNLAEVLTFHGFTRMQRACWESASVGEQQLLTLRREIDRVTDYYDVVRVYQYPVDSKLAILTLAKKKWRKLLVHPPVKN